MLKIIFNSSIRYLLKNKYYYFINLIGFTFSLTCFFLITLYVYNEFSYDDFHSNQGDTYRITSILKVGEGLERSAGAPFPLMDILNTEITDVDMVTRLLPQNDVIITVGEQTFKSGNGLFVDVTFFDVFDFKVLEGNVKTMLSTPSAIVLTSSEKTRFFGDKKALGQSVYVEGFKEPFRVSGIVADPPQNSHIQFDVLFSMYSPKIDLARTKWEWNIFYTYAVLKPGKDQKSTELVIREVLKPHLDVVLQDGFGISYKEFIEQNNQLSYSLQPLRDIYLHSDFDDELEDTGDFAQIIILVSIALLILIMAVTNYVNYSTASSSGRSKEVAIKKVAGASNFQVGLQYFVDSFIFIFLSLIGSVIIVLLFHVNFGSFVGKEIIASDMFSTPMFSLMMSLLIVLTIISGAYPASYFTRFQPARVLRAESFEKGSGRKGNFRDALIFLQYFVAFIMTVSSIFIYRQLDFANQQELGYNHERVVVLPINQRLVNKRETVKEELLKVASVEDVSITTNVPNLNRFYNRTLSNINQSIENTVVAYTEADYDYLSTLNIKLVQGEFFEQHRASDKQTVVLNVTAAEIMKVTQPRTILEYNGDEERLKVIGVVEDFHFESMHNKIKPLAIRMISTNDFPDYYVVKLLGDVDKNVMADLKAVWERFLPGSVFEYHLLEEQVDRQLAGDRQFAGMVSLFAVLALLISVIGTTSLASFIAEKNRKEISIRKVLGASVKDVVILLNRKFLILIALAMVVALPFTWYFTSQWLQNFYYSIDYDIFSFLLGCLSVIAVSMSLINFQYLRTIRTNPIKYLRR